jgi:hypothetical protein
VRVLAKPLFARRMRPGRRRNPGANGDIPPEQKIAKNATV